MLKKRRKYYKSGDYVCNMDKEIQELIDERQLLVNELCVEMIKIDKGMTKIKQNE